MICGDARDLGALPKRGPFFCGNKKRGAKSRFFFFAGDCCTPPQLFSAELMGWVMIRCRLVYNKSVHPFLFLYHWWTDCAWLAWYDSWTKNGDHTITLRGRSLPILTQNGKSEPVFVLPNLNFNFRQRFNDVIGENHRPLLLSSPFSSLIYIC